MKPTSLVLLFAATTLAWPRASHDSNNTTSAAPVTASHVAASHVAASHVAASHVAASHVAASHSLPLHSTPTASSPPKSTSTSKGGVLSNVHASSCKYIKEAHAGTVSHISQLQADGISVPPFLSGYMVAAKVAESKLGCSSK